jgi:flagellar protein FlaG
LQRAADELQMRVTQLAPELQFSVDQSSGKSIIKFTDRKTNEVIQQFPSKEVLDLIKELDNFQRGLLLNRKA